MKRIYSPQVDLAQETIRIDSEGWSFSNYLDYSFKTVFQPIYNQQLNIIGYEGLVRIKDTQGESISPDTYFSELDSSDDIVKSIMSFLICTKIHLENFAKLGEGQNEKFICINVAPAIFELFPKNRESVEQFFNRLNFLGIKAENIVYEILEFPETNIEYIISGMKILGQANIRTALDDFGSGASNLERVKKLKSPIVKIDKTLVQNHTQYSAELNELITCCRDYHIDLIAEGIETKAQFDYFSSLNLYGYQGFYLCVPKEPKAFLTPFFNPLF